MLRAVVVLAMLCTSTAFSEEVWTTFTDTSAIKDMVSYGDYIWYATMGGAVRINRYDGSFRVFRTEDGLVDNHVNAVAVDSTGSVWFGTNRGLSQYNGVSWKTWNNANGLMDSTISDIAVDSSGRLWITMNGYGNNSIYGKSPFNYAVLQSYNGKSWSTHIFEKDSMGGGFASLILDEIHQWIWIKSMWPIRYNIQSKKTDSYSPSETIPNTIPCAIDSSGVAWFLKDGNYVTFNGTEWAVHVPEDSTIAGHLQSMIIDRKNIKWFGTDQGLARFDGQTWLLRKSVRFPDDNPATLYTSDADNRIWGVSSSGVTRVADGDFQVYKTDIKLPGNYVRSVAVDNNDVKWFWLYDHGVACLNGMTWKLYTKDDGLAENYVGDILVDHNNVKWFGTWSGVSRFDGNTWVTFSKEKGNLPNNSVTALAIDANNTLWVGMYNGDVASFDGKTWENHPGCGQWIQDMVCDSEGCLWVVTLGDYVWKWDGTSWSQLRSPENNLTSISMDHEGVLWVGGGNGGVYREKNNVWKSISPLPEAIGYCQVTSIAEDNNQFLWCTFHSTAGNGGGVGVYDRKSWTIYTTSISGLVSNQSWGVAVDHENRKWFATESGVSMLLDNPSDKYIRVLIPSGGENWDSGTVRRITWQSKGVESLRIEYSADSGENWITIARNVSASAGYYDWICFEPETSRGRIRLSDESSKEVSGVCNADFTILTPVYTTDQGTWTFIPYPPSDDNPVRKDYPRYFNVTALEVDHSGAIWAGLFGGQVFRYSEGSWTSFPSSVTGFTNLIRAIYTDRKNNIWFASVDGVSVSCYNGADWKNYEFWQVKSIYDIAEDRDGVLWFPGIGGIVQLNPDGSSRAHMFGELPLPSALSVAVDENNVKWFGLYETATKKGALASFDGTVWKTFSRSDYSAYSNEPILRISAGIGALCLSGEKTVYLLSDGMVNICNNYYIQDAAFDENGETWILRRDATVVREEVSTFDSIQWERKADRILFPGNKSFFDNFSRIAGDGGKTLWIAADYGLWRFDIGGKPLSVKQNAPIAFDMDANYPNPFNPSTTITFSLPSTEKTELAVYSISGQKIRTLVSGPLNAGTHSICWDGRNDQGSPVASGVYIAHLRAEEHTAARKMLLLR